MTPDDVWKPLIAPKTASGGKGLVNALVRPVVESGRAGILAQHLRDTE